MIKTLSSELEDNRQSCSQGQLTRLCNVLGGYREGFGIQETLNETLGREFALLMEIDDLEERLDRGRKILELYKVPQHRRVEWLEPLTLI
jgi:hypothetical protein